MSDDEKTSAILRGLRAATDRASFNAVHTLAEQFIGSLKDYQTDLKIEALRDVYVLAIAQMNQTQIEILADSIPVRAEQSHNFGKLAISSFIMASTLVKTRNTSQSIYLHKKAQDFLSATLLGAMQRGEARKPEDDEPTGLDLH